MDKSSPARLKLQSCFIMLHWISIRPKRLPSEQSHKIENRNNSNHSRSLKPNKPLTMFVVPSAFYSHPDTSLLFQPFSMRLDHHSPATSSPVFSDGTSHSSSPKTDALVDSNKMVDSESIPLRSIQASVSKKSDDGSYTLEMEVPGIKLKDVKIEANPTDGVLEILAVRKNVQGKAIVHYVKQFSLNTKYVDMSKISASLEDGILLVKIPKKPAIKPIQIQPVAQDPPTALDHQYHFSVDVPGVKLAHVDITISDGNRLTLIAERKGVSVIRRSVVLDDVAYATAKTSAYLMDGILTIVVPEKQETAQENDDKKEQGNKSRHLVQVHAGHSYSTKKDQEPSNETQDTFPKNTSAKDDHDDLVVVETVGNEEDPKEENDDPAAAVVHKENSQ